MLGFKDMIKLMLQMEKQTESVLTAILNYLSLL